MFMERRKSARYPIIRRQMHYCPVCNAVTDHQTTIWNENGAKSTHCQRCEAKKKRENDLSTLRK
jgi:transcription elongation factor Elf1